MSHYRGPRFKKIRRLGALPGLTNKRPKVGSDLRNQSRSGKKIYFFPSGFLFFTKRMESWVTNWWNTRQSEFFLNDIQEKSILAKFIALEEILFLDEMIADD